jgi:hypothetical protein
MICAVTHQGVDAMKRLLAHLPLLLVLLMHADAHAEGRCPDGYFPIGGGSAGWEGCAPMGPGADGTQEPQPQLETRWGAVATADGALGVAAGQESQESAEQHALAHCQTHSEGKVCKVLIAYYNQCVAVAWGDGGSLWARSPDVYDAEDMALSNCQQKTTNCDIYYSACSYAERVQ